MAELADLPEDWTVWSNETDGRTVLAYRPDVFNAEAYPAPCLPTLYLTHGKRTRRPGANPNDRTVDTGWYVTLYLEPDVHLQENARFQSRSAALDHAVSLAEEFTAGEVDYRDLYQVPRDRYLAKLDELTERELTEREQS